MLAGSLVVGEQIRTESGQNATVQSFTLDATPSTMWDLTVDVAHSFFVGPSAVLVHNCPSAMQDNPKVTVQRANPPGVGTPELVNSAESKFTVPVAKEVERVYNIGNISNGYGNIKPIPAGGGGAVGLISQLSRLFFNFFNR